MNTYLIHFVNPTIPTKTINESWKNMFTEAVVSLNLDKMRDRFEIAPLSFKIGRILCSISNIDYSLTFYRKNGPAIECENGNKYWYINGQKHREDGPAIEYTNGDKVWCKNGQLHREDGPA